MAANAPAFQNKARVAILAELEKERRRLIQTSQSMNTPGASIPLSRPNLKEVRDNAEQQHFAAQQKAALQHAHAHSTGYFITQDSSFGNLILPVIPRLEPQSWPFTFAQCRIQMTYLVQIISVSFNCLLRHLSSLYKHSQGSINMLFNFVDLPSSLQLDCQQILQTLEIKCILKC